LAIGLLDPNRISDRVQIEMNKPAPDTSNKGNQSATVEHEFPALEVSGADTLRTRRRNPFDRT